MLAGRNEREILQIVGKLEFLSINVITHNISGGTVRFFPTLCPGISRNVAQLLAQSLVRDLPENLAGHERVNSQAILLTRKVFPINI